MTPTIHPKLEIPNAKFQINPKPQNLMTETTLFEFLNLDDWNLLVIWNL